MYKYPTAPTSATSTIPAITATLNQHGRGKKRLKPNARKQLENVAASAEINSKAVLLNADQCTKWLWENYGAKLKALQLLHIDVSVVANPVIQYRDNLTVNKLVMLVAYEREDECVTHCYFFFDESARNSSYKLLDVKNLSALAQRMWKAFDAQILPLYEARQSFMDINKQIDLSPAIFELESENFDDKTHWIDAMCDMSTCVLYDVAELNEYLSVKKLQSLRNAYRVITTLIKREGYCFNFLHPVGIVPNYVDAAFVRPKSSVTPDGLIITSRMAFDRSEWRYFRHEVEVSWAELQEQYGVCRVTYELATIAHHGDSAAALTYAIRAAFETSAASEFISPVDSDLFS